MLYIVDMAESLHIRMTEETSGLIEKVKAIMKKRGFPTPNISDAIRFAMLDCIANSGGKK
jgi:hypothetical protein